MLTALLDASPAIDAVGYRVVHGGAELRRTSLLDDHVLAALRAVAPRAPQHLPPVIATAELLRRRLPGVPHVVAFDTAFHAFMPDVAATEALPGEWRSRFDLRRYGFHGLSYASALPRAATLIGRSPGEMHAVLAHLGGGCSVCAVRDGQSVWTSMGGTPLDGLVMTRRSGSVDPGTLLDLITLHGLSPRDVRDGLERRGGLLGLSGGLSADTRDLVDAAGSGDASARFALAVFAFRARQAIAAAASCLDRLDALVFTGEIAGDQPELRDAICSGLGIFGVHGGLRAVTDEDAVLSAAHAPVPVVLLTVGDDLEVAAEVHRLLDA